MNLSDIVYHAEQMKGMSRYLNHDAVVLSTGMLTQFDPKDIDQYLDVSLSVTPDAKIILQRPTEGVDLLTLVHLNRIEPILTRHSKTFSDVYWQTGLLPHQENIDIINSFFPNEKPKTMFTPFGTMQVEPSEYRAEVCEKENMFLYYSRTPRSWRWPIALELLENPIRDRVLMSFHSRCLETPLSYLLQWYPRRARELDAAWRAKNLPILIDSNEHIEQNFFKPDFDHYASCYMSIVSETAYYNRQHTEALTVHNISDYTLDAPSLSGYFMTEKTTRTIVGGHAVIAVSTPGYLAALRDCGFKTFSPWIDETYDQIEDDQDRMDVILAEINRLSKQTDTEWVEFLRNVDSAVRHNQDWYRHVCSHDTNLFTQEQVHSQSTIYHQH